MPNLKLISKYELEKSYSWNVNIHSKQKHKKKLISTLILIFLQEFLEVKSLNRNEWIFFYKIFYFLSLESSTVFEGKAYNEKEKNTT